MCQFNLEPLLFFLVYTLCHPRRLLSGCSVFPPAPFWPHSHANEPAVFIASVGGGGEWLRNEPPSTMSRLISFVCTVLLFTPVARTLTSFLQRIGAIRVRAEGPSRLDHIIYRIQLGSKSFWSSLHNDESTHFYIIIYNNVEGTLRLQLDGTSELVGGALRGYVAYVSPLVPVNSVLIFPSGARCTITLPLAPPSSR